MAKEENVRATMKALEVKQFHDFALERYDYVVSCRTRLQNATGRTLTSEILRDIKKVRITRTA